MYIFLRYLQSNIMLLPSFNITSKYVFVSFIALNNIRRTKMKWTLVLLACLLVAVISHCYAEEDNDMKELSEFEDALTNDERDIAPMDAEDEEDVAKLLHNKAVRELSCCH